MPDDANVISFSVHISDAAPTSGWPQLVIIVDGEELFAPDDEGIGDDPWLLSGPSSVLLTVDERVETVRICDCGDAGCGWIEVRIRREGHRYVWDGWRVRLRTARPLPILTFDAEQYEAAVRTHLGPLADLRRPG